MTELTGDKYLITGGAGFIGSHIAQTCVEQGKQVVVVDNLVAGSIDNLREWWDKELCTFVKADVAKPADYSAHMHGVDVVFHQAASKCTVCFDNPDTDLITNALGTLRVAEVAHAAGVKHFVHASTGSTNKGRPASYYGVSKLAGESYLRAFANYHDGFDYTVLRYYHIYGPRQNASDTGGVIPIFTNRVVHGEPMTIFGDGSQVRHFTHVDDCVEANLQAAEGMLDGPLAVANREDVTITALAHAVNDATKYGSVPIHHEASRPGDIAFFRNIGKRWSGSYTPFADGLPDTVAWYEALFEREASAFLPGDPKVGFILPASWLTERDLDPMDLYGCVVRPDVEGDDTVVGRVDLVAEDGGGGFRVRATITNTGYLLREGLTTNGAQAKLELVHPGVEPDAV